MDETVGKRLEEHPIPADHDPFVKCNGDLLPGRPRPIAKSRGCEDNRGDANDPNPALC